MPLPLIFSGAIAENEDFCEEKPILHKNEDLEATEHLQPRLDLRGMLNTTLGSIYSCEICVTKATATSTSTITNCILGHKKGEILLVTTVIKCSKQNRESDITNLNTRGSTDLDARIVEKVLMRSRFTRNTTVHAYMSEFGVD